MGELNQEDEINHRLRSRDISTHEGVIPRVKMGERI